MARLELTIDSTGAETGERRFRGAVDRIKGDARAAESSVNRFNSSVASTGRSARSASQAAILASPGFRNLSLQMSQVAQQASAGGGALRALAIQLPDMAIGFHPVAVAATAVAATLATLALNSSKAEDALGDLIDEANDTNVGLGSIRGSISEIIRVQEAYTSAIEASEKASGGAASAVVANSKREFEARKQVLGIELELLNIRKQEQREALRNLQDQARVAAEAAVRRQNTFDVVTPAERDAEGFAYTGPRTAQEVLGPEYDFEASDKRLRAIRRIGAELELLEVASDEAETALNSIFTDVGTDNGGGGGGGGGTARRIAVTRSAVEKLREEYGDLLASLDPLYAAERQFAAQQALLNSALAAGAINAEEYARANDLITDSLKDAINASDEARDRFSDFFTGIITGAHSAREAVANLAAQIADRELNLFFDRIYDGISASGGGSILDFLFGGFANGGVFNNGSVVPFASGGVVSQPTIFPMASGQHGLMGESGPEAIMPLRRGPGGRLGVEASGGQTPVNVKNIVVFDRDEIGNYMQSPRGERIIIDVLRRNGGNL